MTDRNRCGAARGMVLLILLGALVAGGGWNYRRNLAAEEEQPRPYRTYSAEQVEQLLAAHRQEVDALGKRYEAARSGLGEVQDRAHLDQRVSEFERVQSRSERIRQLGGRLAALEGAASELEAELIRREAERDRVRLFLRRLLTF